MLSQYIPVKLNAEWGCMWNSASISSGSSRCNCSYTCASQHACRL